MALASKPKKSRHYQKSHARHHRQSKHYLKTYWPYLPMLAIMGAGAILDRAWQPESVNQGLGSGAMASFNGSDLDQATTRLDALTGSHIAWLASLVGLLALVALAVFMARNGLRFQRVLVRSEHFISNHPMLDVAAVFIFTSGFILTH